MYSNTTNIVITTYVTCSNSSSSSALSLVNIMTPKTLVWELLLAQWQFHNEVQYIEKGCQRKWFRTKVSRTTDYWHAVAAQQLSMLVLKINSVNSNWHVINVLLTFWRLSVIIGLSDNHWYILYIGKYFWHLQFVCYVRKCQKLLNVNWICLHCEA